MKEPAKPGLEDIVKVIRQCLAEGLTIDIESVGSLRTDEAGQIRFRAAGGKRVFLAYTIEDAPFVETLFQALEDAGFHPWMDRRKLLPGQNWPKAIERAISKADFFIPCFSQHALSRPSRFHAELRYALERAAEWPLEYPFVIPVRLEDCPLPRQITAQLQYIDLFPEPETGLRQLLTTIRATSPSAS